MQQLSLDHLNSARGGLSLFQTSSPMTIENRGNGLVSINDILVDLKFKKTIEVREIAYIDRGLPSYHTKSVANPQYRGSHTQSNCDAFFYGLTSAIPLSLICILATLP